MAGSLQGKVVVITGASSGIGAALAVRAAGEGASVVLAARRAEELGVVAARCGEGALAVPTDVTRRADVQALLRAGVERFGHLDALVNNAGRGMWRPVDQLSDEDLDEMMLVNVKSVLYGMQSVLPYFTAQGSGHIINVSSVLGRVPFASGRAAYSAAKHAMNALTANLRNDLRATHPGIHVTLFLPGVVATDFGLNARHGGPDNRSLPNAQPVEEVADVLLDALLHPRAEVYSRPSYKEMVAGYYAADLDQLETSNPMFASRPAPR